MSSVQLEELKKDLAKEEPVISDNIVIQPATTKSKNSRNQAEQYHTFADTEENIQYSESFKKR